MFPRLDISLGIFEAGISVRMLEVEGVSI